MHAHLFLLPTLSIMVPCTNAAWPCSPFPGPLLCPTSSASSFLALVSAKGPAPVRLRQSSLGAPVLSSLTEVSPSSLVFPAKPGRGLLGLLGCPAPRTQHRACPIGSP